MISINNMNLKTENVVPNISYIFISENTQMILFSFTVRSFFFFFLFHNNEYLALKEMGCFTFNAT